LNVFDGTFVDVGVKIMPIRIGHDQRERMASAGDGMGLKQVSSEAIRGVIEDESWIVQSMRIPSSFLVSERSRANRSLENNMLVTPRLGESSDRHWMRFLLRRLVNSIYWRRRELSNGSIVIRLAKK
jgi:hypothetical protein